MVTYTDNSILTWGKYQGYELKNIPASYLLFIYNNYSLQKTLSDYIERNLSRLQEEARRAARENRR